jgi:hypothetical protein
MSTQEADYRVVYPVTVRAALQSYLDALILEGWDKKELATIVDRMDTALKRNPIQYGEPHYHVRQLGLLICVGFSRPFSVRYGILEEKRIVFVREITLMRLDIP